MPDQDLTPQLRMRLVGVERAVGVFLLVAALLALAGLAVFLKNTAARKGWFLRKVPYYCYAREATGLAPGDPVRLLGRAVGTIRSIEGTPPEPWFLENNFNLFIQLEVWEPYFGYLWSDSRARLLPADFFGKRLIELTRGETGVVTVIEAPDFADLRILNDKQADDYVLLRDRPAGVWLQAEESAPLSDKVNDIVTGLREGLPALTNRLDAALVQAAHAASNAQLLLADARPAVTNLALLSARLHSEPGALGAVLLPPELRTGLHAALAGVTNTLAGADGTLTDAAALAATARAELTNLTARLALTLDHAASLSSNLNAQVEANSLILTEISSLVVGADDLLQGLKRNWLLRGAFPSVTNAPLESLLPAPLERP